MKKFKRTLALLLTLTMLLTAVPLSTFAVGGEKNAVTDEVTAEVSLKEKLSTAFTEAKESTQSFFQNFGENVKTEFGELKAKLTPSTKAFSGDYEYIVIDGTAKITKYTGSETDLIIPSEMDGYQVTAIADKVFYAKDFLNSVTIPDGVKSIGDNAFRECRSLQSVMIPNSVTSVGYCVFYGCQYLKNVTIPGSLMRIGDEMFDNCKSLRNVTIQNGVKIVGFSAFRGCEALRDIIIPSSVTCIESGAFERCISLQNITIPDSVTIMEESIFYSCKSLRNVTLSKNIDVIGSATFRYCTVLQNIVIPSGVVSINSVAFEGCESLKSVTLPKSVTMIDNNSFGKCKSLTDINYEGNEDDWNNIIIRYNDEYFTNATIHYNYNYNSDDNKVTGTFDDYVTTVISNGEPGDKAYISEVIISGKSYKVRKEDSKTLFPLSFSEYDKKKGEKVVAIVENGYIKEFAFGSKSIAVYTTEKSLSVKTGEKMSLAFSLFDESTEEIDETWKKMSIVVSNPEIISFSDYEKTEDGYKIDVTGKKQGDTNVTITDTETGANTVIVIRVRDVFIQTYSYAVDNMKVFYPNNKWEDHIATNIYDLNGIYVNNYQCEKSGDIYNIEFDVYNSKFYAGAVDVYDKSGMWLRYEEIEKYSDSTNIIDTGKQAFFLISNTIALLPGGKESNLLTYEQESFSKQSHIRLKLHEGEYFTISNNVSTSRGTFFINALEMIFDAACDALDLALSTNVKATALSGFKKSASESFANRLIAARNEGLKNEVKKKAQKVALDSLESEVKKITGNFVEAQFKNKVTATDDLCESMVNLAEIMVETLEVELDWQNLLSVSLGLVETAFIAFSGPAGTALKGCFAMSKASNKLLMAVQMASSTEYPYVNVYSEIEEGFINPYGVIVNTNGNIDRESILQVFRVTNVSALEILLDVDNPLERHELYNICFVKDDKLVQPNGKVKVHIPIPEGMNSNTCAVYRQEEDGTWTLLQAVIEGNYLVFETDHFSFYAVIGDQEEMKIVSLPDKTVYRNDEIIDTTGLQLSLGDEIITSGFICAPSVLSGSGKQKITVIYGCTSAEFTVEVVNPLLGDVNFDGVVNAADAVLIQRYEVGLIELTPEQLAAADTNGDGEITAADAVQVCRVDAGIISKLVKNVKEKIKEVFGL